MSNTISPQALAAKIAEKSSGSNQAEKPKEDLPSTEGQKVYQFFIAPCTYRWQTRSRKGEEIQCPDGIYRTNDPVEIRELDAKVKAGLLREIIDGSVDRAGFASTTDPVSKLAASQQ